MEIQKNVKDRGVETPLFLLKIFRTVNVDKNKGLEYTYNELPSYLVGIGGRENEIIN